MKTLILSREALFTSVWEKPIKQLANELDLSHSSITTACVTLNIPKPESGYWSKVKYNPVFDKPSLPEVGPDDPMEFNFTPYIQDRKTRSDLELLLFNLELNSDVQPLHPLVKKSKKAYKKATLDKQNRLLPSQEGHIDLKVTKSSFDRANSVTNMLFYMFDALNWKTSLKSSENSYMNVVVNGINISFFIKEKVKQEAYKLTATEQRKRDRGEWVFTDTYSFIPTGELHLILGDSATENRKAIISTQDSSELKKTLIKFCSSLIPTSRRMMVERDKREAWHKQYELDNKKKRDIEEEREKLIAKQQKLESDTQKWHKAEQIRSFIEAKLATSISQEIKDWSEWAYEYANSIDPLINSK